jgi:hypothetical protein
MHDHITAAISAANASELDQLVKAITAAWAAGTLDDDAFSAAYAAAHRRRADLKEKPPRLPLQGGQGVAPPRRSIFPPRRSQKSPDRRRSIERRRRLAASGPMPPALAARFTTAELACLRVVSDEVRIHGVCSLTIAEIAARAGVCRTSCQNALRAAARAGMVHIEEQRQRGAKNLPNRVTITSTEWLTWLARGPKGTGFKKVTPTVNRGFKRADPSLEPRPESGTGHNCYERESAGWPRTPDQDSREPPERLPSADACRTQRR